MIAFEGNGGGPAPSGGWESSAWTFTDGTSELVVRWDESAGAPVPPEIVANGSITMDDYQSFFGFAPTSPDAVVSYLLFSLPMSMNLGSPDFSVQIRQARFLTLAYLAAAGAGGRLFFSSGGRVFTWKDGEAAAIVADSSAKARR